MTGDTKNVKFVKKAFLSGISKPISFDIEDASGVGFKPDALTMSIYDCGYTSSQLASMLNWATTPTTTIVNSQNDADVLANCDTDGHVEVTLTPDDTEVDVATWLATWPATMHVFRHVLFTATFGSPAQVEKLLFILTITPDREVVAS